MPDSQLNQSLMIDEFWTWLTAHYNCILRAGGPGFVVFDQPDIQPGVVLADRPGTDQDSVVLRPPPMNQSA